MASLRISMDYDPGYIMGDPRTQLGLKLRISPGLKCGFSFAASEWNLSDITPVKEAETWSDMKNQMCKKTHHFWGF